MIKRNSRIRLGTFRNTCSNKSISILIRGPNVDTINIRITKTGGSNINFSRTRIRCIYINLIKFTVSGYIKFKFLRSGNILAYTYIAGFIDSENRFTIESPVIFQRVIMIVLNIHTRSPTRDTVMIVRSIGTTGGIILDTSGKNSIRIFVSSVLIESINIRIFFATRRNI